MYTVTNKALEKPTPPSHSLVNNNYPKHKDMSQYFSDTNRSENLAQTIFSAKHKKAIQKKKDKTIKPDYELNLGLKLIGQAPEGISLAIYDSGGGEFKRRANDWAKTNNAVATAGKLSAKNIKFGRAIKERRNLKVYINKLIAKLKSAAQKAAKVLMIPLSHQYKIKNLAFFAHGISTWVSISQVSGSNSNKLIKGISANLKNDVNVILFSCSGARSPSKTQNWVKGTMDKGGKGSLANRIRNALAKENIDKGKVWGHTTMGHTTRNPALRFFNSADGKGSQGLSFASEYIFKFPFHLKHALLLLGKLIIDGYNLTKINTKQFSRYIYRHLKLQAYNCYIKANRKKKFDKNLSLAGAAPTHPEKVATIVRSYWNTKCWPKTESKLIKRIIKRFHLKKN